VYQVENHAGRLIEVKLASPLSVDEVQQFAQNFIALMGKIPGKYIGVASLLEAYVFPPAVAEGLSKLLSGAASHVERSAFLIGESAVFGLQVERVIREANNPNRRAFRDGHELVAWLSEVMTPHERQQLERFIRESTATVRH